MKTDKSHAKMQRKDRIATTDVANAVSVKKDRRERKD